MKVEHIALVLLALAGGNGMAQKAGCPVESVLLALGSEIRGYPAHARGTVPACQVIAGANTGLGTAHTIAFGRDGSLHVAQFLTNGTVETFAADANGDTAPLLTLFAFTNDLISIAVDSHQNDFVISVRQGGDIIRLTPGMGVTPPEVFLPPMTPSSLAIDRQDHLLVSGWDRTGAAVVTTFDVSGAISSAPVVRSLMLGMSLPIVNPFLDPPNLSIALDPATQDLFVYTDVGGQPEVRVFAAGASGSPTPLRTIEGPNTGLGGPGSLGTSKIAVGPGGRLYVAEPGNRILVFGPGARGDAEPDQIIQDTDAASGAQPQGGIGVRSFVRPLLAGMERSRGPR